MTDGAMFVSILGATVQGFSQLEAAEARKKALELREMEEQAAADQRSIQRTEQLSKAIGAQEAAAGARGIGVTGGSFRAIEANSFDEWAKDQRAIQIGRDISKAQTENAVDQTEMVEAGAVIGTGANIFSAVNRGLQPTTSQQTFNIGQQPPSTEQNIPQYADLSDVPRGTSGNVFDEPIRRRRYPSYFINGGGL